MTDKSPDPSPRHSLRLALFIGLMVWLGVVAAVQQMEMNVLFEDRAAIMVDGKRRILVPGEPSPEGVLLISSDSHSAVLEIDGVRSTWRLGQRLGDWVNNRFTSFPVQQQASILPDEQGIYRVGGYINGFSVPFVVDTGTTLVSMNSTVARRLGIDYRAVGEKSTSKTDSGHSPDTYLITLDSVQVGDIELKNIQGSVHEGSTPDITLLGMSFLGRLSIQRGGRGMELQWFP